MTETCFGGGQDSPLALPMFVEFFSGQLTVDRLAELGSFPRSCGNVGRKPADWLLLLLLQPAVCWLGKHMQLSVVF